MIKETFQINNSDKYRLDVYIQDESPEINLSHLIFPPVKIRREIKHI